MVVDVRLLWMCGYGCGCKVVVDVWLLWMCVCGCGCMVVTVGGFRTYLSFIHHLFQHSYHRALISLY